MGIELLRHVHFALRKVAPRDDGKHCKTRGSSTVDPWRRSSFRRRFLQGNSRQSLRVGFGGRSIPNWLQISSATLQQKSPARQNCAAAASSHQAESFQPFCENAAIFLFAGCPSEQNCASDACASMHAAYAIASAIVRGYRQTF